MDGNGRWAKAKGLPRIRGHEQGVEAARRVLSAGDELGIEIITFYVFSADNWDRPSDEVGFLMDLLGDFVAREGSDLVESEIRLRVIGDISGLPEKPRGELERVIDETSGFTRRALVLAINYGSQEEIARAASLAAADAVAGKVSPEELDVGAFSRYLYTADLPEPDLLIRTAGELRLSNFLLWQLSYTELYFTDVCWPDFDRKHLEEALDEYRSRRRTFGGLA